METYLSAILCKSVGPGMVVMPPDEVDIYNFAAVPIGKDFDGWVDDQSPFEDMIPKGTRWIYAVHTVMVTEESDYPLQAGKMVAGPFIDVRLAEQAVGLIEKSGYFVCVYAALIHSDKDKLN
jgi:hypothetical protein